MNKTEILITRTIVASTSRLGTLPVVFERHAMWVESTTFEWMRRLNGAYRGGYWEFYNLSNGGFYMGLAVSEKQMLLAPNGYQAIVSADAASIIAGLYALCNLANNSESQLIIEKYHQLRDYALGHDERNAILAAID